MKTAEKTLGKTLDEPIPYRLPLQGRKVTTGAVLVAVRGGWAESGRPPTLRELGGRLGVQPTTLLRHLDALEADGLIERERSGHRFTSVWPAGLRAAVRGVARG